MLLHFYIRQILHKTKFWRSPNPLDEIMLKYTVLLALKYLPHLKNREHMPLAYNSKILNPPLNVEFIENLANSIVGNPMSGYNEICGIIYVTDHLS